MLFLKEQEVRELLPMGQAVESMRSMFAELRAGTAQNQPRRRMYLPTASVLHSMAGACGKYYGTKIYSTNARVRTAEFLLWLLDAETAKPLALMEANWLGQIRTGAASAYATDLLAVKSADRMGVIGAGFQARSQVEAIAAVRSLREVRVWSRQESNRARFADDIQKSLGIACVMASSAEEAVAGMPIVTTATWAKDPVLESSWIAPGAVVNAMGSNNPERRELPAELIARAGRIVVDSIEVAKIESGDLLLAWGAEDFRKLKGIGHVKALQLLTVMEVARRVVGQQAGEEPLLNRAELIAAYLQPVAAGLEVEKFWVLCLNRKNRLIKRVEISSGSAHAAHAHPREVFRVAVREAASAIACAHNHPSGDPAPSAPDMQVTRLLREAARAVDILLIDHVILGRTGADPIGRGFFSFREAGLM